MNKRLSPKALKTLEKLVAKTGSVFSPENRLFPQQLRFVRDTSRFKTAVCTRRSGKSVACAVDLLDTALKYPGTVSLYITLSRLNGKRIIWPILTEYNREFNLGGTTNDTEVSIRFPNGSTIYIAGAKDKEQIEKFRGLAIKKAYLDEAQSFPPFIESLVDEVIAPALFDYNGSLVLIGTPGPIPAGYFHDCSQSANWSHHFWSIFDNPFIQEKSGKTPEALLQEDLNRRDVDVNDPKIQREYFGRWTTDLNSLVYKYSAAKADYDKLPEGNTWNYVLGIDIGFNDADAIAVLAYSKDYPEAYLVDELIAPKQDITQLVDSIQGMVTKYAPERMVIDTGGLGRKIAEELNKRHQIGVIAADKVRKYENIELLNDALNTGKLKVKKDSRFAFDSTLVEWDRDKSRPDKLVVSNRYHSDICDAVLYAFKDLYHWLYETAPKKVTPGSIEFLRQIEAELEQAAVDRLESEREEKEGI